MSNTDSAEPSWRSAQVAHGELEQPVYCALTRFGLRGPRHLLPTYREYRQLVRETRRRNVPGLLQTAFLVENASTCYSLSLWSREPFFSAEVPAHVDAANGVFKRLSFEPERGPELWSTQWKLTTASNNLNWDGFDLRHALRADPRAA